jgi:hypothetical protein
MALLMAFRQELYSRRNFQKEIFNSPPFTTQKAKSRQPTLLVLPQKNRKSCLVREGSGGVLKLTMMRRIFSMRFWRSLQLLIGVVIFGLALVPRVRADVSNQKVIFSFDQPVETPGKVIGPGTYVFRVLDTQGSRNIVQVLDKDETHVIATYITVGEEASQPPTSRI